MTPGPGRTAGTAVELVRADALDRVRSLEQDGSALGSWLVGGGTLAY
ncbi:hypothetical protein [Micromonospora palythoicola]